MATSNRGTLLLVIPSVIEQRGQDFRVDGDFANNVEAYLRAFDAVTVACPARTQPGTFPNTKALGEVAGNDRLDIIVLPEPYREDRFIANLRKVKKTLRPQIESADYILVSPHAAFDWSTLAAEMCIDLKKKYNMESDWNMPQVTRYIWSKMPLGINKLRKLIWLKYHTPKYFRCLQNSSLALVQGEDVYNEYKNLASNVFPVLNIQVTNKDKISPEDLDRKVAAVRQNAPMKLVYAGRAAEMKGAMKWLEVLDILHRRGVAFHASWFGAGELLDDMKSFVVARGLSPYCDLPGNTDRATVFAALQSADAFLFCHMTKESPRCVVEALAAGAPLIGFGTDYSRSLVREKGGGAFVECGDVTGLADLVDHYASNRKELADLIANAAASGQLLDRETAIAERISLMKQYLKAA